MVSLPFCPNPRCDKHVRGKGSTWFAKYGTYPTRAFGVVPRYRCLSCGRTFSRQTFSIDFFAKKVIDYRDVLTRLASSESVRAMSRAVGVSCGTTQNRIDRLSRQAVALHSHLRRKATLNESICVDGFVSFDVSKYFPSEVSLSISSTSRLVLDLSHASRRRSGAKTPGQRRRAARLYDGMAFERGAVSRTFREVLESALSERPPSRTRPFILVTDEKKEYATILRNSRAFRRQDGRHRVVHLRVNSRVPRTSCNPLFASNYLDREIRKDLANHHRATCCFNRNVANGMARLACYLVHHNYLKRYLIKSPRNDTRSHAEVAGIDRREIHRATMAMFKRRGFISHIRLPPTMERIWRKGYGTPLKDRPDYLPGYALD